MRPRAETERSERDTTDGPRRQELALVFSLQDSLVVLLAWTSRLAPQALAAVAVRVWTTQTTDDLTTSSFLSTPIDDEDMEAAVGRQSSLDEPDLPSDQAVEVHEENDNDNTRGASGTTNAMHAAGPQESTRAKHLPKKTERRASQEYYDILYGERPRLSVTQRFQESVQLITRKIETNRSKLSPPGRTS